MNCAAMNALAFSGCKDKDTDFYQPNFFQKFLKKIQPPL
jgi:hypothetical protein